MDRLFTVVFMIKKTLYWYLFTKFFYKVTILADIAIFSTVRMEKKVQHSKILILDNLK